MKSVIRSEILKRLSDLSAIEKAEMSSSIQNHLKQTLVNETGVWVGYQALPSEPQLNWLEVSKQIQWAFPVVTSSTEMSFKKSAQVFNKSGLGVQEPVDGESLDLSEIAGFVVPAVAYDQQGYRLGRGKGYYDRSLLSFSKKKIGVCFGVSLCETLPREQHDLRCDTVITENGILNTNQSEGDQKWN